MRTQQLYRHLLATVLFLSLVFQRCGEPNEKFGHMEAFNTSEQRIKTTEPVLSTCYGPFTSALGALVTLQQTEGRWNASVVQKEGTMEQDGKATYTSTSESIHEAARTGNLADIQYLVDKKGMDVNAKANDGATALHLTAEKGYLAVMKYFVEEKKVDVKTKDNHGWTALHGATYGGHLKIIKWLVEKGADVNAKDKHGWTALHRAAENGKLENMKYLIEVKGGDVNTKTNYGWTTLHVAAEVGNLETILYLIEEAGLYNNLPTIVTPQDSSFSRWEHIHPYVRFIALADTLFSEEGCQRLRREPIQEITDESRVLKLVYKGNASHPRKESPHDMGTAFANRFKNRIRREGVPEAMLLDPERYFKDLRLPESLQKELQTFVNDINEGRREFVMEASSLVALLESKEASQAISATPLSLILCPPEGFSSYDPKEPIQKRTVAFYTQRSPELARLIGDVENERSEIDSGEMERALCKYLWTHLSAWELDAETFKAIAEDGDRKGQVVEQIKAILRGPNVIFPTGLKAHLEQTLEKLLTPDVPEAVEELKDAMQKIAPHLSTQPELQDAYQNLESALSYLGSFETSPTGSLPSQQGIAQPQQGKEKKRKIGD